MKSSIIITFITIMIVILILSLLHRKWEGGLISPNLDQTLFTKSSPLPLSGQATPKIKTFKFNSATDLKKELDSVNPEIGDSDFE